MDPVSYFYSMLGFEYANLNSRQDEPVTISQSEILDSRAERYSFRRLEPVTCSRALDTLSYALLPIYIDGFLHRGVELSPEREVAFLDDLRAHIAAAKKIALIEKDGSTVGFVLSEVISRDSERIYHLAGIVLSPKVQGRDLATLILAEEIKDSKADILAFHTQSVKMFKVGTKLAEYSESLADEIAAEIHSRHAKGGIDLARYRGGSLYGDIEKFRSQALPSINFEQGDAQIFAGRVTASKTPTLGAH